VHTTGRFKQITSVLLIFLAPAGFTCAQTKTNQPAAGRDSKVVHLGIQDFHKIHGSPRVDALEDALPQVLRADLYFQKWLDISLLGKSSLGSADLNDDSRGGLASKAGFDLILEGEILELAPEHIRVNLTVTDVLRHGVIYRDSIDLDNQQVVYTMGQAADRLANFLREKVLYARTGSRLIAVIGPFENNSTDAKLSFLNSSLPLKVSENTEKLASGKNLTVQPMVPGVSDEAPKNWDIQVTGSISADNGLIVISATYGERSGLRIPIDLTGTTSEPLKTIDDFSRKVWEVLAGRMAPQGGFRNEPLLAGNSSAEDLLVRGVAYEKAGDADGALFMYGMALRKKNDYPAAHLGLARVYRNQEAYEWAEAHYLAVLAGDNQNAAGHFGLGMVYSKRGDYDQAVRELEQAATLAPDDQQMQSEAQMQLGDVYLLKKQPDPAKSIQHYLQAQTIDKSSPAPYLGLGRACRAKDDMEGAVAYLRKGLAQWPTDASLINGLALSLNSLGKQRGDAKDAKKALEAYEEAIKLNAPDTSLRAASYLQAGIIEVWTFDDYADGMPLLEQAAQLRPQEEFNLRAFGMAYRKQGKYKEAIDALNKAAENGAKYETYWELAYAYYLNRDYESGIKTARKALDIDPQNADGFLMLGAMYVSKLANTPDDQDSLRLANANLNQSIKLDPSNQVAYRLLGILRYQENKDQEAIDAVQQSIKIRPTALSYVILGEVYKRQQKKEEAINSFSEAIKLDPRNEAAYDDLEPICPLDKCVQILKDSIQADPNYANTYIRLALKLRSQNSPEEALQTLDKAIAIDKNSEWAYRVIGFTYSFMAQRPQEPHERSKAEYEKAITYLDKANQVKATEWSYTQLGNVYGALGDKEKALNSFAKAIQISPMSEDAFTSAEAAYDEQGRGENFNNLLEAAVAKDPKFYWGRLKLAARYYAADRYDDAIQQASKAVELEPRNGKAFRELAQAERAKKEYAKAYEHGAKALDLSPKDEDALWTVAYSLFDQKKYQKAVGELSERVKNNPDSALGLALLANAYRLNHSYAQAHEFANKAIALSARSLYAHWVEGQTYFDEKKYPEALAAGKEVLKLGPDYRAAQSLLYTASHSLGKDQEAVQILEQLRAEHPKSRGILESIGFISHEYTKNYAEAYDVFKKAYEMNPSDWTVAENFAEASLTVGHFDEVLQLTNKVIADADASAQSRLSMKFLQIAAYLMRGEQGKAFAELGIFRDQYKNIPKDYDRGWTYDGTKEYIRADNKLKPTEKGLLLQMLALLEAPQDKAGAELKKFEDSFAKTFMELKASAALPR
jgi:tetratricopeptide (TPR) repeat protein